MRFLTRHGVSLLVLLGLVSCQSVPEDSRSDFREKLYNVCYPDDFMRLMRPHAYETFGSFEDGVRRSHPELKLRIYLSPAAAARVTNSYPTVYMPILDMPLSECLRIYCMYFCFNWRVIGDGVVLVDVLSPEEEAWHNKSFPAYRGYETARSHEDEQDAEEDGDDDSEW